MHILLFSQTFFNGGDQVEEDTAKYLESTILGIKKKFLCQMSTKEKNTVRRLLTLSHIAKYAILAPSQHIELQLKLEELRVWLSEIDEDASNCIKTAIKFIKTQ